MAKKKREILNYEPLPLDFHPKDARNGVLFQPSGTFGSAISNRGTVYIAVGGAQVECTVEAAQKFVEQVNCAINCAKNASV